MATIRQALPPILVSYGVIQLYQTHPSLLYLILFIALICWVLYPVIYQPPPKPISLSDPNDVTPTNVTAFARQEESPNAKNTTIQMKQIINDSLSLNGMKKDPFMCKITENDLDDLFPSKKIKQGKESIVQTSQEEKIDPSEDTPQFRCACEGGFLPPGLLRSFAGAESVLRLGTGQCYHKM